MGLPSWLALAAALLLAVSPARADEAEPVCDFNAGDVGHGWAFAFSGCPRSVHFDLSADFVLPATADGPLRMRFGAEPGFHWAVDEARRLYVGPALAVTGGGLAFGEAEHELDNWRVAPKLHLRGFLHDFVSLEASFGPVFDFTHGLDERAVLPRDDWRLRPGGQLLFGPRIMGVVQLRAGYEHLIARDGLPSEGRFVFGFGVTLGGALIGAAIGGVTALCAEGGGCW